ncbi:MAG: hypothetical protein HeimC2_02220 [Candidatus Heimdallarchaeota archaeon LC_2]|nr:MAG: hypothetical protein HeimC2_02220 [Candidatus Heimdallarchaeota archaeon LC_2]
MVHCYLLSLDCLLNLVDAGKYSEALIEIDSLEYPDTMEGEFWRINIIWYKFQSEDSVKFAEKAIEVANSNGNDAWKLMYYLSGTLSLIMLRSYDQVLDWIDKSEELKELIQESSEYKKMEPAILQLYLAIKAYIHLKSGLLDDSISLYKEAVEIGEAEQSWKGFNTILSIGYSSLGNVYLLKGMYDEALIIFKKRLTLAYEMKNLIFIWRSQQQISEVYWKKNQYFDAYHNLRIVLAKFDDFKDRNEFVMRHKVQSLFKLVIITLKMSKFVEAKEYYEQLELMIKKDSKQFPFTLKLAEALILKSSDEIRDKIKALDLLIEIINEIDKSKLYVSDGIVDDNIPLITLLNLYDLYLWEYKSTDNKTVIKEIDELSSKLIFIALSYNSYPILGEAILLDARYNKITGNLKYAKELYVRAISLSKEQVLDEIAEQAEHELDILEKDMNNWTSIINISESTDKDDNGIEETSQQLMKYKFLLNPVKLSIVKILINHNKFPSAQLRTMLGISWGKFSTHVDSLVKEGLILSEKEFIDNKPRTLLFIEQKGRLYFQELRNVLKRTIYAI